MFASVKSNMKEVLLCCSILGVMCATSPETPDFDSIIQQITEEIKIVEAELAVVNAELTEYEVKLKKS